VTATASVSRSEASPTTPIQNAVTMATVNNAFSIPVRSGPATVCMRPPALSVEGQAYDQIRGRDAEIGRFVSNLRGTWKFLKV
jgi:hypothetical protein